MRLTRVAAMSSAAPKFIDVTGFPDEGEHVPPTPRAVQMLVAQGWTPPGDNACPEVAARMLS
jgi:hypothetical protein